MLRAHCDDVGHGQSEITRSVHLPLTIGDDPAALADRAAEFFAVGVDLVVWSMQGAIDVSRLGPLAEALRAGT